MDNTSTTVFNNCRVNQNELPKLGRPRYLSPSMAAKRMREYRQRVRERKNKLPSKNIKIVKSTKKRKRGSNEEPDSDKDLNAHVLKTYEEHSETNMNTVRKMGTIDFDSSLKKSYKMDNFNENPIEHVTTDGDNAMLSVKCEEHTAMETDAIEQRYIPQEVENEKCITLPNKNIKEEPIATDNLTSIQDGLIVEQLDFIKREVLETNTEQLQLENEVYTVTTLGTEHIKTESKTTVENLVNGIIGDQNSFEGDVAVQDFVKDEPRTEHLQLENDIYTIITLENENIKMQTEASLSETPHGASIDDQTSFEDEISETSTEQLLLETEEYTVIKKENESTAPESEEKLFACTECNRRFLVKESLDRHMRQHSSKKPFTCTKCKQCFTRKQGLEIHIRRHTGVKPYACIECNKSFAIKRELNQHMRRHTGEKPYTCPECDKCFAVKHALIRHMKGHTGEKPHICSECNKSFTRKQELDIHMRRHTGEKPYTCTECNKHFAVKQAMNRHMKRHTGEKPYTCTECNRGFSIKESLKSHMRLHTGEKPYSCTECNKTFTAKQALYYHITRHACEKPHTCSET